MQIQPTEHQRMSVCVLTPWCFLLSCVVRPDIDTPDQLPHGVPRTRVYHLWSGRFVWQENGAIGFVVDAADDDRN